MVLKENAIRYANVISLMDLLDKCIAMGDHGWRLWVVVEAWRQEAPLWPHQPIRGHHCPLLTNERPGVTVLRGHKDPEPGQAWALASNCSELSLTRILSPGDEMPCVPLPILCGQAPLCFRVRSTDFHVYTPYLPAIVHIM